jgi:hypothetical protein
MSRAEGVINVDIGQRRERLRESPIVAFFFFVEAKIFEQDYAEIRVLDRSLNFRADTIGR